MKKIIGYHGEITINYLYYPDNLAIRLSLSFCLTCVLALNAAWLYNLCKQKYYNT